MPTVADTIQAYNRHGQIPPSLDEFPELRTAMREIAGRLRSENIFSGVEISTPQEDNYMNIRWSGDIERTGSGQNLGGFGNYTSWQVIVLPRVPCRSEDDKAKVLEKARESIRPASLERIIGAPLEIRLTKG